MSTNAERWLVTGASGQLGGHVVRQLTRAAPAAHVLALAGTGPVVDAGADVKRVDLRDTTALRECAERFGPTHILHLGAIASVADAYANPADAWAVNVDATRALLDVAQRHEARLVFSSTDMVFAGDSAPYRESDVPRPLSRYGATKVAAEGAILGVAGRNLVVRVPLMYGLPVTPRATTFAGQISALREGKPLRLFTDEFRTPVSLADAARALLGLARSTQTGLIHVAGPQRLSRYEMVATFARLLGLTSPALEPVSRLSVAATEPRPADLSLDDSQFRQLFPTLSPGPISESALRECAPP